MVEKVAQVKVVLEYGFIQAVEDIVTNDDTKRDEATICTDSAWQD